MNDRPGLISPSFSMEKYFDFAGVMLVVIAPDQTVKLVNKKACTVLGYEGKEIVGKNWFDHFLPERIKNESKRGFERILTGDIAPYEYVENLVLTKNGREKIIAWNNTLLKDETENIIATLSSGVDITERIQAEKALREAEKQFRLLFEKSTDAVLIRDRDGIIRLANPMAIKMLRASKPEEVIGKAYLDFVHPDDRPGSKERIARQTRAALGGQGVDGNQVIAPLREHRLIALNGDLIDVESTGVAFAHQGELFIQGIFHDRTERKKLEEEREKLILKLREALAKVKALSGLLPICASCKKIRDDKGYWNQIEIYLKEHSEAEFSHGLCPDCLKKLYPDFYPALSKEGKK